MLALVEGEKLVDRAVETRSKTTFITPTAISLSCWKVRPEALQDFGSHLHHYLPRPKHLVAEGLLLLLLLLCQCPLVLSSINDLGMLKTRRTGELIILLESIISHLHAGAQITQIWNCQSCTLTVFLLCSISLSVISSTVTPDGILFFFSILVNSATSAIWAYKLMCLQSTFIHRYADQHSDGSMPLLP